MWIREATSHPPAGAWLGMLLTWARAGLLAGAVVFLGAVIDAILGAENFWPALIGLFTSTIAGAVAGAGAEATVGKIWAREERNWRHRVVAAALGSELKPAPPMHGRQMDAQGQAVDAATNGAEKTANYRANFLIPTLAAFSAPVMVLIVWAIGLNLLTAAILAAFLVLVPLVIIGAGKFLRGSSATYRRKEAQANAEYLEMIEGLGTYKVLGAAPRVREKFARSARSAMAELSKLLIQNQRMIVVNDLVFSLFMSAVGVWLVLWQISAAQFTLSQGLAGILLTLLLNEPIDKIGRTFYVGLAGRARRDQLDAMLPATATPISAATDVVNSPPVDIELDKVSAFRGEQQILHEVSMRIPAGAHLVVIGPSGAGKSTLLSVLDGTLGFTGEIRVDGEPVDDLTSLTTMVSQQVQLTSTTVADNLELVAPGATDSERQVALERAAYPLDSAELGRHIGDAGALLSGGQRRRVALAQAFLRDTPVLLLDEATADLDRSTQAQVTAALAELGRDKTVIHVAHRLDLARDADLVAVVDHGRLTAFGTPEKVLADNTYFSEAIDTEDSEADR